MTEHIDISSDTAETALALAVEEEVNRRVLATLEKVFSMPDGILTQHAEYPELSEHVLMDSIILSLFTHPLFVTRLSAVIYEKLTEEQSKPKNNTVS